MRRFILYCFLLTAFAACIDPVQLPVRTEAPRLVVEGQITNEDTPYVRLTYTGNYTGADGQTLGNYYVQNAQVSVTDDQGRSVRLAQTGLGFYQTTDTTFRGKIGRSYSLSIVLSDGKRYQTQPERMPAVPLIDSISARLVKTDNLAKPYAFAYGVNTSDPANAKNYYRWTAYGYTTRLSVGVFCSLSSPSRCNNRCWTLVSTDVVNVYSDEAINGKPLRNRQILQLPVYALGPQLVEIQQYGITQANYQFWKLYQQQSARTGSIFDPLPAPIIGNVINVNDPTDAARGYFAVTSITRRRLRQATYNAPFYGALTSFVASQPVPDGDCRDTYGQQTPITEPPGW